ncbi:cytochrome b/b6 domain-containing protein, partial [Mesorhizobium sp.]|uniref:cytochrome b/b6 domain-containing protein n=1 Tax=Mesorhizobium sp. TaxID=1871066 RepID=UPI0025D2E88F
MDTVANDQTAPRADGKDTTLVYRQSRWTRLTHWIWAFSLFFMLLSGLQIFNARPQLYIGKQSGFEFNNTILQIGA